MTVSPEGPRDILGIIQGTEIAGDQWRIVRPFTALRALGIRARWCTIGQLPDVRTDPERTVLVVRLLTGTDRATTDRWLAETRQRVRTIVFELDDVLWGDAMVDHLEAAEFTRGKTRSELLAQGEMARYFASRCDGVIVSSAPLAASVRPHTDRPVLVVPNAIDVRWFRSRLAGRTAWADHLTIGWAGGRRPEADVAPMAVAWGRIARRYPAVRFVLASSLVPDVFYREVDDLDRIIRLPWTDWEHHPSIYQTDIGCASVADTPFSRAKTPIKAWEYALAGAAVVASSTLYGACLYGAGFLAETADEWEDRLALLVENQDFRKTMRDQLVRHVKRHHALDDGARRWTDALRLIVSHQEGSTDAAQEGLQQEEHLVEHQDRTASRQAPEASGGDRALGRASGATRAEAVV